jgi:hypothetical protein
MATDSATAQPPDAAQKRMQISGNSTGLAYEVAVATKMNQSTREQGKQALQLIQSAMAPAASASPGVGTRLNVVA